MGIICNDDKKRKEIQRRMPEETIPNEEVTPEETIPNGEVTPEESEDEDITEEETITMAM